MKLLHAAKHSRRKGLLNPTIDGPFANKIFAINRDLNFDILSDFKHEIITKYVVVMNILGPLEGYNAAK